MKLLLSLLFIIQTVSAQFYDRPVSPNFLIRWGFQELCDFHFDTRYIWPTPATDNKPVSFNAADVKPGDMVFVRDAEYYFKHKHPHIKVPYFILTHGEFLDKFESTYFKYLNDEKILGWFTIHPCDIEHERVFPLPLGIVQYKDLYDRRDEADANFKMLRNLEKKRLLCMNFTDWRNPKRKMIRDLFIDKPYCKSGQACTFKQYIKETAESKFVVSPPGLGPDCYRVWEAFLVGTIPIVEHSHLDFMYEGLPVLFIDDWQEVTEEFLHKKYEEITSKTYNPERLSMEYWIEYIKTIRAAIFPQ